MIVVKPVGPCSSITGSASGLGTPNAANEGPIPRRITCFGALPATMKPPMPTLASVRTRRRVDRLSACAAGVTLGLGLGVGVGVAGIGVWLGVGLGVGVAGGGVWLGVGLGVGVAGGGVPVAVALAV